MGLMRNLLLVASTNPWLRERAPRYWFVRRTVSRFMPGEEVEAALAAARVLEASGITAVLTRLGENISDPAEAERVTAHYLQVLDLVRSSKLPAQISVKPTQLGLDLDAELCYAKLQKLIEHADAGDTVWIDMEASNYVDATLDLYRRARRARPNVGVCLQSYLYRTEKDLASLMPLGPTIRLVKGAYKEPPDRAFPRKKDVDENFFALAKQLLSVEARRAGVRAAIATHDLKLIERIKEFAASSGLSKDQLEFQFLYGIQREGQKQLAREGYPVRVLISYGAYWFPWFVRRLAERPANVLFMLRHMLTR
jgi:proline dehydrogenase